MAYRTTYKAEMDRRIYGAIKYNSPVGVWDIRGILSASKQCPVGAVRNALKRLLAANEITREWDGNQRYGRYIYKLKAVQS